MRSRLSGSLILLLLSITSAVVFKHYQYNGIYYKWSDAQNFCKKNNGDLATIYTQAEMNNLWLKEYIAWIGLHRDQRNQWKWTDGSLDSWNNWAVNEPNPSDDCAVVNYNNKTFYGASCDGYSFFICENYFTSISNKYTFIPESKTWNEAQRYCQNKMRFLADFNYFNPSTVVDQDFPVWIGLRRDGGSWSWSSGFSDYKSWNPGEPSNSGDCVSITSLTKRMTTQNCDAHYPFICMWENLFLVKENKSWEEALEYCRGLTSTTNLRFDLPSVEPGEQHMYVMTKIIEANSDEVWTGLRFLAGEWLWVNGEKVLYAGLPDYPALEQHCGAISKSISDSLEARDCLERKNFLCYIF
ncbi:macrophage mannose receptor 1-like [Nothobranchius furzeri]|uniref:Macrophage mannose receptor 1-like n=2 Tax=Nothobranchius furzeri TaxID=105023 RepID=A0A9D3BLZ7_NOTFU|nr:macrophage mannose receptor 1-like [Nothobranchius furzeri]